MRNFWARILAKEVAQPNQYSLRTLDYLRSLSQSDAQLIQQIAPYFVEDGIPIILDSHEEVMPLKELLHLADIGILSGVESDGLYSTYTMDRDEPTIIYLRCNDKIMVASHKYPRQVLKFMAIPVTKIGREIMSLGQFQANVQFIGRVSDCLKGQGFVVEIFDIDTYGQENGGLEDR